MIDGISLKIDLAIIACRMKIFDSIPSSLEKLLKSALKFEQTVTGYVFYLDDYILKKNNMENDQELDDWFNNAAKEMAQYLALNLGGKLEEI